MVDLNEEIKKIKAASFFSQMGVNNLHEGDVILIENVRKVFIEPSDTDFKGFYKKTEWLPSSPTQDDPFYKKQVNPKDLVELRKEINKYVMTATRELNKANFSSSPHDFSVTARNAICFAFRQLITERYFSLGNRWERITDIYYSGHWPVGFTKEKYIVI
ncbi:hypothetical protein BV924_22420 [Pectobacterium odoriferum]|uniref:Uncharacterized protein n=1 Tax=Pectobacterium odoriferum TaxID=78398 RepID=A0ABD6VLS7_9GAMM|nr:hypothetical protein [Pectobacterium odoriferum]POD90534.1 hypothetical protein BVY06_23295 [Pectobacterium odoriferum]POD96696.1 hypothetical protein BVY05_22385 [Pectobacterium odoriferum]POE07958.1 hypothetical protein BV924_22420 [Pectobacterium odoriferum]POE16480.1 hypothetical protein BV923_23420 [Pectobacterium odoriferum]POE25435.1 hypothetical protein BV926_16775 [Pectobacterium odoriferum]